MDKIELIEAINQYLRNGLVAVEDDFWSTELHLELDLDDGPYRGIDNTYAYNLGLIDVDSIVAVTKPLITANDDVCFFSVSPYHTCLVLNGEFISDNEDLFDKYCGTGCSENISKLKKQGHKFRKKEWNKFIKQQYEEVLRRETEDEIRKLIIEAENLRWTRSALNGESERMANEARLHEALTKSKIIDLAKYRLDAASTVKFLSEVEEVFKKYKSE